MTSTFILTSNNGSVFPFSYSRLDPFIHAEQNINQNPNQNTNQNTIQNTNSRIREIRDSIMANSLWRMPSAEKLYPQPQKVLHRAILKANPPRNQISKTKFQDYSYTKFEFRESPIHDSPIYDSPFYDLPPYENSRNLNFQTTGVLDPKQLGKQFLRQRARSFEKSQVRGREIDKLRSRSTSSGRRRSKGGKSSHEHSREHSRERNRERSGTSMRGCHFLKKDNELWFEVQSKAPGK